MRACVSFMFRARDRTHTRTHTHASVTSMQCNNNECGALRAHANLHFMLPSSVCCTRASAVFAVGVHAVHGVQNPSNGCRRCRRHCRGRRRAAPIEHDTHTHTVQHNNIHFANHARSRALRVRLHCLLHKRNVLVSVCVCNCVHEVAIICVAV